MAQSIAAFAQSMDEFALGQTVARWSSDVRADPGCEWGNGSVTSLSLLEV